MLDGSSSASCGAELAVAAGAGEDSAATADDEGAGTTASDGSALGAATGAALGVEDGAVTALALATVCGWSDGDRARVTRNTTTMTTATPARMPQPISFCAGFLDRFANCPPRPNRLSLAAVLPATSVSQPLLKKWWRRGAF